MRAAGEDRHSTSTRSCVHFTNSAGTTRARSRGHTSSASTRTRLDPDDAGLYGKPLEELEQP